MGLFPGSGELTEGNYEAVRLRFRRLDPTRKDNVVGDDTLRTICNLKGLNAPLLINSPSTARFLDGIRDKETDRIDFLKLCQCLARTDWWGPVEEELAPEATATFGNDDVGIKKQAETSNCRGVRTADTGDQAAKLAPVQLLVRVPKWEKEWQDQTSALPRLRTDSTDQDSKPAGLADQLFVREYLTACERLVWGGESVPELPAFELVIGNNSDVGFSIDYFGVEVVAAGVHQFEDNKKHLPPFLAKCDFVLSIPTLISANGEVAQRLPFVIKHELTAPLFLRPEGVYAFSLRLENSSHEQASAWLIRLLLGIDSAKIQSELIYIQRYQAISQLVKLPRFSAPS